MTVTWNKVSSYKLTEISSGYDGLYSSPRMRKIIPINKEDKWHDRVDMGRVLH
jgi:hypothetical protein